MKRFSFFCACALMVAATCSCGQNDSKADFPYNVPAEYLEEAENIPAYWIATTSEVEAFLKKNVKKGELKLLGKSAGGRPIYSVTYGTPRQGKGTATHSGAASVTKISAYRGPDADKKVYMTMAGVHGFELEGIVGVVNMISVFETGKDLAGIERPELASMLDSLDRVIILPLCNPDGRDRIPIRMEKFRGHEKEAGDVHQYLNTGGREGGKPIGWPACKEYIPMNFDEFEFPGGYPNDNGYNLMHDNFFGELQPENKIIYDVVEREKPDVILNMHTGVGRNNYFTTVIRPGQGVYPPMLEKVWFDFNRDVNTELTLKGLKKTNDLERETKPRKPGKTGTLNLTAALAFQCGGLSVTIEEGSHGFTGIYDDGTPVPHTPEKILNSQLATHEAAMRFLYRRGGVTQWEKDYK